MKKKAEALPRCSPAEFESLPEPLRRKYFSPLERLRIAEEHALHESQSFNNVNNNNDEPAPPRRSLAHAPSVAARAAIDTVRPLVSSSHRRLRRAESLRHDHYQAQADADFFLSLPPKLQRSAFSREEQTLILGRCDSVAHPSHPPPVLHLNLDLDLHHDDVHRRLSAFRFAFEHDNSSGSLVSLRSASSVERGRTLIRQSSAFSFEPSPQRRSPYPPSTSVSRPNTSSSLLFLDAMSPLSSQPSRASFRRTLSLTNIPIRPSTSSANLPLDLHAARGSAAPWHQRSQSQAQSGRRSSHIVAAPPVFDPEATHYQDAETRKKLQFLASPQKFDEALEFGFPSTNNVETLPPRYQLPPITTDARQFSRDMHTFLREDRMSILDAKEEENKGLESDNDSVADFESPVTPSSVGLSFRNQPHSRKQSSNFSASLDSTGVPLIHPVTGRLNREMTLRMTLTRPDLRADEDQLYGWQGQRGSKDDPFALEDLPLSDDMNGTKGPFYVKPRPQGNLVSRLFKRHSKKGR